MIVFQLAEAGATFVETVIGEMIIAEILNNEKINWKYSFIAATAIMFVVWSFNQLELFSFATSIVAAVSFAVSAYVIYRRDIGKALVISADYIILIYVVDFLTISILGVIFHEPQMAVRLTASYSLIRVLFLSLSKGILMVLFLFFNKYFLPQIHLVTKKMQAAISTGIILVYCLVEYTFANTNMAVVFTWMMLLALVILGAYSVWQYSFLTQEKSKMEMVEAGNRQICENYEQLIRTSRENQIFFHDLKNHYVIIRNYLKHNEYEKAKCYMEELDGQYPDDIVHNWTGIRTLDILIQCKKKNAEARNIKVEVIADQIQWRLEEHEAITLIGNALDNAIESCRKIEHGSRWIRVAIRNIREMIFIKVENSCHETPIISNDRFFTSKKEKNLHGFGLTSMKFLVEKYDGAMSIESRDKVFTLIISFSNDR